MPFLIENITEVASLILTALILANGVLIVLAVARRQRRDAYFRRLDEMRMKFDPIVSKLLTSQMNYQEGIEALNKGMVLGRVGYVEKVVLGRKPTPEQAIILSKLCEDLGLVRLWQARLTGRIDPGALREGMSGGGSLFFRIARLGFLVRAQAAENLAAIRHQSSWPLFVQALDDPHPDLQTVAARALATLQEPESFQPLVERMHRVILDSQSLLSLRTIKSVLIQFPVVLAPQLIPSLLHANRRIRYLATDIIREMVERQAGGDPDYFLDPQVIGKETADLFLSALPFDENPDVRARSASVVSYLNDPRATAVLLMLLQSPEWFVRLHGVRAMARRKYLTQLDRVAELLTDPQWMVREASAHALMAQGRRGADLLTRHFLSSDDRYSQEQIADEMQRFGMIPEVLEQYAVNGDGNAGQVLEHLLQMGKTSYMVSYLESEAAHDVQRKFMSTFGARQDPQIQGWMHRLARQEDDPILRDLAQTTLGAGPVKGDA